MISRWPRLSAGCVAVVWFVSLMARGDQILIGEYTLSAFTVHVLSNLSVTDLYKDYFSLSDIAFVRRQGKVSTIDEELRMVHGGGQWVSGKAFLCRSNLIHVLHEQVPPLGKSLYHGVFQTFSSILPLIHVMAEMYMAQPANPSELFARILQMEEAANHSIAVIEQNFSENAITVIPIGPMLDSREDLKKFVGYTEGRLIIPPFSHETNTLYCKTGFIVFGLSRIPWITAEMIVVKSHVPLEEAISRSLCLIRPFHLRIEDKFSQRRGRLARRHSIH